MATLHDSDAMPVVSEEETLDVAGESEDYVMPFESYSCPICMDPLTKTGRCITACGHQFCLGCFIKVYRLKPTCPLCRDEMITVIPAHVPVIPAHVPVIPAHVHPRHPTRNFHIVLENRGDHPFDIYWISPRFDLELIQIDSICLHRNITPGSTRRIHVGKMGDRIWIDWSPDRVPRELGPRVTMNDVFDYPQYSFSAAPQTTYLCCQNRIVRQLY